MLTKRGWFASFVMTCMFVLLISATITHAQVSYTTTWVANSYSTIPTYVGNAMRSMWVAPEGAIYTASMWDESQGSINIYQNGHKTGTIGLHGEAQGGAISGDATDLFSALQFNTTLGGSGFIGRYNRSTGTRDLTWSASSDTTERRADVITGIADTGTLVYVSDHPDNLVRCYTTAGVWQSDWALTDPGAIAIDGSGNIWVAQMSEGTIQEFAPSGNMLNTINMGSSSRPSALYYDSINNQLMVGDQGPNMNIQIYGNLSSTPSVVGTFGVQGGYLDSTTGSKGQTGSQRFTRIVGIGKDASGNLYVLNNPWGGTWDLGRNGKTDLHAYNSSGVLQYTLQALNFEGNAAFDPGTDGAYLYSGQDVYNYSSTGGAGYVANSVDALDYPTDPRVDVTSQSRGFDFGLMADVNGHRILAAAGQNSDAFLFSYFPTNQYVSVPFGSLPGQASAAGYNYANYFNTTARVRNGFCLDTNGDIWVGLDKTNAITHYPLTGFDANGMPIYGTPTTTPTPSTIAPLGGIEYIPSTDTMVLMNANGTDWTSLGGRVEVYHGWKAGHTTNPDLVINLKTAQNPKGRTAAGNYLFISYVHTVPDIDAYNLTTGADDLTMTSADPNVVVGNDVDSMYGIRAYQTSTGDYLISKDNYNENSIVIHRMTVVPTPDFSISAKPNSQTVTQGSSTTYTTTIGALNGFTDTVNLSVTGLPTGATATFDPASITTSGSTALTVSTATTTPPGTYTLIITGATSTLSRTATVTLVVPGPPDFNTSASPSSQTVTQGNGTTYTASISPLSGFTGTVILSVAGLPAGATASFSPMTVSGSGNSALTVSTSSTTPTGTYPLTITGTDGTLSHSATVTLVVTTPDFSISSAPSAQTAAPGNSTTYTTTIDALNGFTGTVNLSVNGLPSGATASFSPASISTSGSSTLTVSTAATTPTGAYTLTITGTDGSLSHSAPVTLVVNANAGGLPTGWTDLDVGGVSLAGSANYSNGTFTVNGAGTSISGTADQFNYAYQAVTGTNYTITARVVSLTNTNSGAQAGVMIRETLDAGSTMADINVTPANGVTWIYRSTTGAGGSRTPGLVAPYWVRVVRSGDTFTGYYSVDGVTWTQQGTVSISMADNVFIGLVVSSRASSELATATFDNVSVITPGNQPLTISPQAATTTYGSATMTLTATAAFTGSTNPTGSLVFQIGSGNQVSGNCSVSSNTFSCTASYPTSNLAAGSYTINVSYAGDSTFASSSASSSITVNKAAPTVTAIAATCIYNASGCSGGGSVTGVNGEALTPVTLSYSGTGSTAYGPTATPPIVVGTYAVTAKFTGNNNYTSGTSTPASVSITPAPTTLSSFTVSPNPVQYSDPINISATPLSAPAIGGNVSFFINYGTATQQQLGATQTVSPNGTATVSNVVLLESVAGSMAPGAHNVTVIFTPADPIDFTGSINTAPLSIAEEDANLTYTGQYLLYTSSPSTYSVTAPLTFTVQDSNAVPSTSPIYDLNPGDIRNARFKILVDGVATPGCSNLQPSLVTADTRVGTIGCTYTFSFSSGQAGETPTITVVPDTNSYYAATSGDSDFSISVNLPSQTNFITGGGYLVNNASAGTYAGGTGLNTNFGFNVKYNKGGTSLQGNVNIIVRSNGRLYQIKGNSISSLGVTDTTQGGYGTFIAKANIQDVTDPLNPISIEGDDSLTISFHDNGTPGTNDTIAISVYKGGILRFASDWNGTATAEQNLGGGNLAAH